MKIIPLSNESKKYLRFEAGDAIRVLQQYWKHVIKPELCKKKSDDRIIQTGDFIHFVMFSDKSRGDEEF